MYALIENNEIKRTTDDLRKEFPNTSFANQMPDEFEGWIKVTGSPENNSFQKVASREVVLEDGAPVFSYTYEKNTQAEAAYKLQYYRQRLNGGITVNLGGSDTYIPTKEEDRGLINGAVTRAILDNDDTLEYDYFPVGGGRIPLTNAAFKTIGRVISNHTQSCLNASEATENIEYDDHEAFEAAWESAYSS